MRTAFLCCATFALGLFPLPAFAQEAVPLQPTVCSTEQLVRMDRCQLLALYTNAEPGAVPHGYAPGRAIFNPGSPLTVTRSRLTSHVWQGKVFLDDAHMINKVFGHEAVTGAVCFGESWYDGKRSIIIDYTGSWWYAARYRDEFREVAPGIYLGLTYERRCPQPELKVFFALDARCGCR